MFILSATNPRSHIQGYKENGHDRHAHPDRLRTLDGNRHRKIRKTKVNLKEFAELIVEMHSRSRNPEEVEVILPVKRL
jgi:hypothetical protein